MGDLLGRASHDGAETIDARSHQSDCRALHGDPRLAGRPQDRRRHAANAQDGLLVINALATSSDILQFFAQLAR